MIPVILSGGNGTRLWPLSRKGYPKQFLPLVGDETLFQQTIQRLPANLKPPIIMGSEGHRFIVAEQLQLMGISNATIILEPYGRNTAPAVAIAAMQILKGGKDDLMLVLAADHHIADTPAFRESLLKAQSVAEKGLMVLFGIEPSKPETGYGYIRKGMQLEEYAFSVDKFVEKPDLATAQTYVDSGEYLWNSGMFMMSASVYLQELEKHAPEIFNTCTLAFETMESDWDFCRLPAAIFEQCQDKSIDYAVMEHTDRAAILPLNVGWSDVGAWSELWEVHDKDENQNALVGDVYAKNAKGCFVHSKHRLTAVLGVEDLIIIDSKDALLVARRDQVQSVKQIVDFLIQSYRQEAELHREVARPWGSYDSLDSGDRFQVKHIRVKPGARLSLQKHHHRAEHWVVVKGTALVTIGEKEFLLSENESTYIPVGEVHRLTNPGKIPLELIEIQSGSYLGEDDIVRLDDVYGRILNKVRPIKEGTALVG